MLNLYELYYSTLYIVLHFSMYASMINCDNYRYEMI